MIMYTKHEIKYVYKACNRIIMHKKFIIHKNQYIYIYIYI